jgi:hypothetical protein
MTIFVDSEKITSADKCKLTTTCLQKPRFLGQIFNFRNIKVVLNNDHFINDHDEFRVQRVVVVHKFDRIFLFIVVLL